MMMEVVLSEKKAKENNIDIDECYEKVGLGFYKGTNKDFSTFAGA